MPDYQLSKVYQIVCLTTGQKYVGTTTQPTLSLRLSGHVTKYKCWKKGTYHFITSFAVLEQDNYQIELLEIFPCYSKDELNAREGHYIRTVDCVNKKIEGRTVKEWREDNPEYHIQYQEANKTAIAAQRKKYREINKTEIADVNKAYHETNKDSINQRRREKRQSKKNEISL
jgi:hypothetical protein